MIKTVRLLKENGTWKVDLPTSGSATISGCGDYLSRVDSLAGGRGELFLTVSDRNDPDFHIGRLSMVGVAEKRTVFTLSGLLAKRHSLGGRSIGVSDISFPSLDFSRGIIYIHSLY